MAFLSGVTGQFYKQFAVTIAISTVISAINSLTLSPALAARLLKAHDAPKDRPSRLIDRLFGWLFRPFNRFFKRSSDGYQGVVSRTLGRRGRSEEHTSELQSLMRISYAVFCLKKKKVYNKMLVPI